LAITSEILATLEAPEREVDTFRELGEVTLSLENGVVPVRALELLGYPELHFVKDLQLDEIRPVISGIIDQSANMAGARAAIFGDVGLRRVRWELEEDHWF